jgi:hypothetical protein
MQNYLLQAAQSQDLAENISSSQLRMLTLIHDSTESIVDDEQQEVGNERQLRW